VSWSDRCEAPRLAPCFPRPDPPRRRDREGEGEGEAERLGSGGDSWWAQALRAVLGTWAEAGVLPALR